MTPSTPDRVDPLTGDTTHIVARRQGRPNLPSAGCPFCPGGIEAPEPYDVRWFTNRWPALDGDRAEVVLYTSDHDASFASLGPVGARKVVDLWADRTAALGARDDVAYVLVFENRGPEVGATIAHPHGQIYGYDIVPPRALVELERGRRDRVARPRGARRSPGDRPRRLAGVGAVGRDLAATSWSWPRSTRWPTCRRSTTGGRDELGAVLVDALGRLDRLFDEPMPYMLWFHQRPTDGGDWPSAWLHAHVVPINRSAGTPRFVAAAELGGQVYFNPVDPDDAARALRDA